ncbi:MAG: MBL fold metallo-hydrolase [Solirubrobacteraceae bacterium]
MLFQQVLNDDLGCASYVLADGGEAIVVDPRWDVDVYLDIAARERVRIVHVVDTHDHADHVSGRARLVSLTGAVPHRPARDGDVAEGDLAAGAELAVGAIRVRAIATPGHRPEHLALAVSDLSRSSEPWLVLSGDSLLVGDLARPDLAVEADAGARLLRESLRGLVELGDHVEVWPGHVGGSLCGGPGLSRKTSSTIGFERRHNQLIESDENAFVTELLANVPARPPNVAHIVEINRRGNEGAPTAVAVLEPDALAAVIGNGATLLDARDAAAYDAAHIAAAINLPASSSAIGTRAGWAIGVEEDVVVVAEEIATARATTKLLAAVGLTRVVGITVANHEAWRNAGLAVESAQPWDVATLAGALREKSVELIDVRDEREWRAGHVAGSQHLPLSLLGNGRDTQLPGGPRRFVVACAGGGRAAVAASLLRRERGEQVVRIAGGGIGDLPAYGIELTAGA